MAACRGVVAKKRRSLMWVRASHGSLPDARFVSDGVGLRRTVHRAHDQQQLQQRRPDHGGGSPRPLPDRFNARGSKPPVTTDQRHTQSHRCGSDNSIREIGDLAPAHEFESVGDHPVERSQYARSRRIVQRLGQPITCSTGKRPFSTR